MKESTSRINSYLNDQNSFKRIESLVISNGNIEVQETTLEEIFEIYKGLRQSLRDAIDKGLLDQLTFSKRHKIESIISRINQFSQNPNQIIPEIQKLSDELDGSGLYELIANSTSKQIEVKQLANLRSEYNKVLEDISKLKETYESIKSLSQSAESTLDFLSKSDIENKLKAATVHADEINSKRDDIVAFVTHIDKAREGIDQLHKDVSTRVEEKITESIYKANELISQAEKALELKETEGIAKAISTRLSSLTSSKAPAWWITGACVFAGITIILAFLLAGGRIGPIKFDSDGTIGIIIGRIVVTAIGLSGATFCATQYTKLRNLQEDYEYKVVLSKSILAFASKIKEYDQDGRKLSEYLTKVLDEIHKDPLRDRKSESSLSLQPEVIQQIIAGVKDVVKR